jgi:hypothetical protein
MILNYRLIDRSLSPLQLPYCPSLPLTRGLQINIKITLFAF